MDNEENPPPESISRRTFLKLMGSLAVPPTSERLNLVNYSQIPELVIPRATGYWLGSEVAPTSGTVTYQIARRNPNYWFGDIVIQDNRLIGENKSGNPYDPTSWYVEIEVFHPHREVWGKNIDEKVDFPLSWACKGRFFEVSHPDALIRQAQHLAGLGFQGQAKVIFDHDGTYKDSNGIQHTYLISDKKLSPLP